MVQIIYLALIADLDPDQCPMVQRGQEKMVNQSLPKTDHLAATEDTSGVLVCHLGRPAEIIEFTTHDTS